ncbi:SDR family oxidoreductase, partial [bacterium]|nr:SDR family oxidoreductase [candidate division CSSED10-310 bacterium]
DVLINNAGIGHAGLLAETSLETWRRLMDINLWGPLNHLHAFLPDMITRGGGHIVNVSSGQAFFRLPTWGPYAVSKLALGALSEILRFETARHGIRVTTVYPFMTNTGFYDTVQADTWGQQLSMKLLPWYSQSPETVGRIIFNAVRRRKTVELVHPANLLGRLIDFTPGVRTVVSTATMMFLGGRSNTKTKENPSHEHAEVTA